MSFEFKDTFIDGIKIIKPHIYEDFRGIYKKNYEQNIYNENGIFDVFNESSDLISHKGVLRGLHYQEGESQAKLLHVVYGKIFDVALDLRSDSKTFGKYYCGVLKGEDNSVIYIPKGFAHGFLTLQENTVFSYQCAGEYIPELCGGIRWDDSQLNIPWPLEEYAISSVVVTDKDLNWPTFMDYLSNKN